MRQAYRVREFAELAGVTVRALHHYDRLGLLKPRRTAAGYRLYGLRDLERLEQIVALKFLGIPLRQIGALLDRAIAAIRDAEKSMRPGQPADAAVLKRIIEVIEMENHTDWMKKYYSEPAWDKIQRGQKWTPELQERVTREWTELFRDVEAALGEDPAGERAQALANRWTALVEEFTQGDREVAAGVRDLYQDRANWPADFQRQMKPFGNAQVWKFMQQAMACRRG